MCPSKGMIRERTGKLQVEDTSNTWRISTNHYQKKKKTTQPNRKLSKNLNRYSKTEYPNGQLISVKALNLINLQGNINKPTMRYK